MCKHCCSAAVPSSELVLPLEDMKCSVARLSSVLDAVTFRNVWRGLAASANKLLYNDIAIQADFSSQVPGLLALLSSALVKLLCPSWGLHNARYKYRVSYSLLRTMRQSCCY